jgi:radical SAM superfamily enzyme YgiQ (UPF0313 family)
MSVQFSRGCPFDCEFCNITAMFGHRPRTKTTAQVIAELDGLRRRGWRGPVFFVDDNFIGNKRALKEELLPALIRWRNGRRGMVFYTEASINLADDGELMRMMVEAGFNQVFVGIETPEDAGLAECNKRKNQKRDLVADVKRIQRAGLEVQGGFIVGFDSDTPATFARQMEFIQKSGIVTAMVGLLQAIPGTKLHQRLNTQGRLIGQTSGNNLVARRLSEPDGTPLRARTVLPAHPHLPARVCAAENRRLVELALFHGVPPGQCPSRHFWPRTFPLLGFAVLDFLPQALAFFPGRRPLHLRLPFSQDLPGAGAVTMRRHPG